MRTLVILVNIPYNPKSRILIYRSRHEMDAQLVDIRSDVRCSDLAGNGGLFDREEDGAECPNIMIALENPGSLNTSHSNSKLALHDSDIIPEALPTCSES